MLIHVVSAGETLWHIANRYAVPMQAIIQLNALSNPNQLIIGQSLVIPSAYTMHIVKKGDTLASIARQYKVPMQAIVQINHLTNPDVLTPGTQLIIPPITHTVRAGETLSQIASYYSTTVQAIIEANNITNPNMIFVGTQLIIPRAMPSIEVNAYSYQPSDEAISSIHAIGDLLTYFSPFAYMIKEDGSLQSLNDQAMIDAAQAQNIIPMLTITNFSSTETGSNLAHVILSNTQLTDKVIDNVLNVMEEKGYKVLNIDFENVLPTDREHYNQFLQSAVNRLHPKGYLVSTALPPKTKNGAAYEAFDYEAHGKIADFVVLMTYEWGYRLGPPQAISPINEITKVVEYALTVMPANKIFLGFQIYARDWLLPHVKGQEAETFSQQEAIDRAQQYGATIQYDRTAQSPFFRYVDKQARNHEVWFEDARSAQAKFNLIKQYQLRGVSYWALGFPFPQNWALLANDFSITK